MIEYDPSNLLIDGTDAYKVAGPMALQRAGTDAPEWNAAHHRREQVRCLVVSQDVMTSRRFRAGGGASRRRLRIVSNADINS
jgi:hypothetical protein